MRPRSALALLLALAPLAPLDAAAKGSLGQGPAAEGIALERVAVRGFPEPHTPGAKGVEVPPKIAALLGRRANLNTVHYERTWLPGPRRPGAILILVPGFLGGAATFQPLARQLVAASDGSLEVWAVDRRPNQLEDRRGGLLAAEGDPASLAAGAQFYFPDRDGRPLAPASPFPGPEDVDVDGDGVLDPGTVLPDALGGGQGFVRFAQDDVRFLAHFGIDTYVRDWRILVKRARKRVGARGLVLFGGHSMGTSWAAAFAAYDFDPGPRVRPAHRTIDGLVLLEGGGLRAPLPTAPGRDAYLARVTALSTPGPGAPNVFLPALFGLINVVDLGAGAELSGAAGTFDPDGPSLVQRTTLAGTLDLLIQTPATNRAIVGFFLDDDFSANPAFRASLGFSDDGPNVYNVDLDAYVPHDPGQTRTWKDIDDPSLPVCGPADDPGLSPGCAILDNGPRPGPLDPPAAWGVEREVSDLDDVLAVNFGVGNFVEWYFVDGRVSLDFQYGRDSSALGDESLLAVTQNANVDVPVLCIGGSNGLTPSEASFADYLGSIATPAAHQRIEILEGYAHVDVLTAAENEAVPLLADWIAGLARR
jgi:pimeloyl-ACP methyl ester carboxylesterase